MPIKYPRTYHLPWSQGKASDDKVLDNVSYFHGKRVIVTRKMDGENTSIYGDGLHARSIDGRNHPSRDWVKNFWSTIAGDIPRQTNIGWQTDKHKQHIQDITLMHGYCADMREAKSIAQTINDLVNKVDNQSDEIKRLQSMVIKFKKQSEIPA